MARATAGATSTGADAYPLTPLQQGMLAAQLRAPGSGVDVEQLVCSLPERIDADALRRAWQAVVDRHEVLRSAVEWEGLDAPRQRAHDRVEVPFTVEDWRDRPGTARDAELEAWLRADRARGFVLDEAPLLRLTLIVMADADHRLVWTFHHAILDGRCFPMVLREAFDSYDAAQRGTAPPPLERRRPFREYVEWLAARDPAASDEFWRGHLAGIAAATPIPVARAVPAGDAAVQGDRERRVDAPATAVLREVAATHGVTLGTIVQAAWALVLSRYSGERDVVFGVTLAGRRDTVAGADEMLGLFIDTLPVRVAVPDDEPVGEWLRAVRSALIAVRAHQHTPLPRIMACSVVPAGQPLFDSLVMYESYELEASLQALGGAWQRRGFRLHEQNGFALTLAAYAGDDLLLRLEFDRTRFDDDTAARLLDHVAMALREIAVGPASTVGSLSILGSAEREQILVEFAGERVRYEGGDTLVERLAAQVARTPDAIAVQDERRALTYAALDAAATALAGDLMSRGAATGALIGVCAERSVELVVALVAVLKAGAAYVPIDPEYPRDRIAFMLEDSGVTMLLASDEAAAALPPCEAAVVSLGGVAERRAEAGAVALPQVQADDSAYMIYTSGSTGQPKGALNAHRGIVNRLAWMQQAFELTPRDVVLQKTPFSFDVSVWEFFWPLIAGARLVMARPGAHRDAAYLADIIEAHGVTVCHFVPSMLRPFVAALADGRPARGRARCETLREVMASGEALTPDLVARFAGALPHARLHNLYGPTECAVDVTWWPCPHDGEPPAVVPIGRAIANTRLYVLDDRGALAPIGVPGELYLAGVQVGLGYHRRPELTAERFVRDPFAPLDEGTAARMYRTGDRARWLADGTVEYLGRLDFQVKVRGFRIELGEIEATLLRHPSVRDCVVDARADADGEKRLVAYVVADGAAPAPSALRGWLLETLPEHMVPGAYVVLDALPLSSNGKVDRRALPDPRLDRAARVRAHEAPRTPAERELADIWSRVLRVERVGITDDFFELGGDSLLSIQIVSQAARAGLRLTLTQVLKHPTVAGQAAAAQPIGGMQPTVAEVPARGEVALTPVQRWFAELDVRDAQHWNQAFLFEVPATLDHDRLRDALAQVAAHHDALRLRFRREREGVWRQWYADDSTRSVTLSRVNLSSVADDQIAAAIEAAAGAAQRSLHLEQGPIGVAVHFELGAARSGRLLLALHHLVVDGVSWRLLREDLERAYEQLGEGGEVTLPPKTSSFASWSAALTALAASPAPLAEADFWVEQVAGGARTLPMDRPEGENVEGEVRIAEVTLTSAETRDLLQAMPIAYGARVEDALLASLGEALAEWMGEGSVIVDLEGHGREEIAPGLDVSRTVGWFTTVFPVRIALTRESSARTRLLEAKETLRRVPGRGLSYGVLRHLADLPALGEGAPAEVMLNYLGQFDQVVAGSRLFRFAGESAGAWRSPRAARRHALEIVALVIGGRLTVRIGYARTLHDAATVERLAEAFGNSLRASIAHCLSPEAGGYTPSDFPLAALGQGALDRLLGGARDVEDVYPATPLQRLFLDANRTGEDPGFQQYRFTLVGALDVDMLREAWRMTIARHDVLRARFVADDGGWLQVVQRDAMLPWREEDWRGASNADERLAALLADDRVLGVDVATAPLMRVSLLRIADDRWTLVWTQHHLLLDRWSWPLVLREVGACYAALRRGETPSLGVPAPFRKHVSWLANQPDDHAKPYWVEELDGLGEPLRLLDAREGSVAPAAWDEITWTLSADETAALRNVARANGLAPNILVEGAWAVALAHLGSRDDVTFGLAVDGRGAFAGAEEIVGPLVNNVPVRATFDDEAVLLHWLAALQSRQAELRAAEHAPLESIQRWSGLPWRHRLFESLLVFQDASAEGGMGGWLGESVSVRDPVTPTQTAYPITGLVHGDDRLSLTVLGDRRQVPRALSEQLAFGTETALRALVSGLGESVGALRRGLPALRSWGPLSERASTEYVEPRTAAERVLARIWGEMLGVDQLGVLDNFFARGGHSLLATQIVSRVRETLQVDVPVRTLFERPTVAELAQALGTLERKPGQIERIAQLVLHIDAMSAEELRQRAAAQDRETVTVHGD